MEMSEWIPPYLDESTLRVNIEQGAKDNHQSHSFLPIEEDRE